MLAICVSTSGRLRDVRASNISEEQERGSPPVGNDLVQIVEGCQRGDRDAQRQLYERFAASVFRVAARIVGREEAADVSQEAFLKAFRSIGQFAGNSTVGTWLHRITVNQSLQHIRRKKVARISPLEHDPVDRSASTIGRVQQQEVVERAIELLSADLRAVLLLRESEDLSYAQISQMLNISHGTVASRISRARSELKRHLIELGWEFENEMLAGPRTVVRFPRR